MTFSITLHNFYYTEFNLCVNVYIVRTLQLLFLIGTILNQIELERDEMN